MVPRAHAGCFKEEAKAALENNDKIAWLEKR